MRLLLSRPLIFLDTETTGTDVNAARIVELGFQLYEGEFPFGLKKEWRSLINPGIPIPADATRTHKITDEDILRCRDCKRPQGQHPNSADHGEVCEAYRPWPTFKQLAPNLAKGFSNCDFAGQNVRYDLRILANEFARASIEWSYHGAYVIDSGRLEQLAVPRTLSDLHKKYIGRAHDDAHGAMSDTQAAARVIAHQLEAHPSVLPADLKRLHELQWPGWIDGDGKFRFVDGVPCFSQWGKHAGKPMKDPSVNAVIRGQSYWDFILGADFSADVKQLARDAKLGKFPEGK